MNLFEFLRYPPGLGQVLFLTICVLNLGFNKCSEKIRLFQWMILFLGMLTWHVIYDSLFGKITMATIIHVIIYVSMLSLGLIQIIINKKSRSSSEPKKLRNN